MFLFGFLTHKQSVSAQKESTGHHLWVKVILVTLMWPKWRPCSESMVSSHKQRMLRERPMCTQCASGPVWITGDEANLGMIFSKWLCVHLWCEHRSSQQHLHSQHPVPKSYQNHSPVPDLRRFVTQMIHFQVSEDDRVSWNVPQDWKLVKDLTFKSEKPEGEWCVPQHRAFAVNWTKMIDETSFLMVLSMSEIYPRLTVVSTQACFTNEKPGSVVYSHWQQPNGGGGVGLGLAMSRLILVLDCEYLPKVMFSAFCVLFSLPISAIHKH